jgi:hypothetical protein
LLDGRIMKNDGIRELVNAKLPAGRYEILVKKRKYYPLSFEFSLPADQHKIKHKLLMKKKGILIRIKDLIGSII